MTSLTEQQLDGLQEQFEESWTPEQCGPGFVRAFLQQNRPDVVNDLEVLAALACIDIELAWQDWDRWLGQSELTQTEAIRSRFERLPRLEAYADMFSAKRVAWLTAGEDARAALTKGEGARATTTEFDADRAAVAWRALVECEAAARSHWGDNPGSEYYAQRWRMRVPDSLLFEPGRVQVIATHRYTGVHANSARKPTLNAILRGAIEIGRQRSDDCSDWSVTESTGQTRIVIAHRMDTTISRNQLWVQVLNPLTVWLQNGSSKSSHFSATGAELIAGQSQLVTLPFMVNVGNVKILFEQSPESKQ